VLTLKNIFFWFMTPCSLLIMYQNFFEARHRLVFDSQQHRTTKNTTKQNYCNITTTKFDFWIKVLVFLYRKCPNWASAATLLRFLDHTQLHTHTHTHIYIHKIKNTRQVSSESVINSSQRLLPTQHTSNRRNEHPCCQRDSNPRSQQSDG